MSRGVVNMVDKVPKACETVESFVPNSSSVHGMVEELALFAPIVVAFNGVRTRFGGDEEDVSVILTRASKGTIRTVSRTGRGISLSSLSILDHFLVGKIFMVAVSILDFVEFFSCIVGSDLALIIFSVIETFADDSASSMRLECHRAG